MFNVCVLLSTYNGQTYLQEQLNSILSQKFKGNISVVVRDDGSSDNTLTILKEWKHKENILVIPGENVGPKASFFELIKQSPPSDFYAFCDQDDVWESDKVAAGVEKLLAMPQAEPNLFFSNAELVDGQLVSYGELFHKVVPNYTVVGSMVCNPALGCTTMFNIHLMDIVKTVDPVHTPMHDKFVLLTALLLGNVTYDHVASMRYRQHNLNVCSHQGNFRKRIRQSLNLWFNSKQTTLDKQAQELLNIYYDRMTTSDINNLMLFAEYKKSVRHKLSLLTHPEAVTTVSGVNRSFIIRTILGLV